MILAGASLRLLYFEVTSRLMSGRLVKGELFYMITVNCVKSTEMGVATLIV